MNRALIQITNEGIVYEPILLDGIVWETERSGSPGKLTFSVLNDNTQQEMKLNIQEGNMVVMRYGEEGKEEPVFCGYIFTKKRDKNQIISITAYDQLRYFKNKLSIEFENIKASEIVKNLAEAFSLQTGELDDTREALNHRADNDTIFDIILDALDETVRLSGKVYVLYDDFGKINLKNIESLKLDCEINENTAFNFSYESSIDGETYNEIQLYYDDSEASSRTLYEPVKDEKNIERWGLLRLSQKIDNPEKADIMAKNYLQLYNSKRRSLSVTGVLGDLRARAGASVPVNLVLGDVNANSYLLIEKAKHTFQNGAHTMDLTLRGDIFV